MGIEMMRIIWSFFLTSLIGLSDADYEPWRTDDILCSRSTSTKIVPPKFIVYLIALSSDEQNKVTPWIQHFAMALSSKLGNSINADYYLIHKTSAYSAPTRHFCTDAYTYAATKINPSHESYDSNIQKLIASTGGMTCRLGAAHAVKQHFNDLKNQFRYQYDNKFAVSFTVTDDLYSFNLKYADVLYDFLDKNDGHDQFFRLINDENLDFLDSAFIVTNQLYGKIGASIARKSQYFGAFLGDFRPVQNTSNENKIISPYYSSCRNYFGRKSYERLNNISQRRQCPMILPENSDPHTVKSSPQEQWIDDLAYQFSLTNKAYSDPKAQLRSQLRLAVKAAGR